MDGCALRPENITRDGRAFADGFQVDASATAREAGIQFPVFLTRSVWDRHVEIPKGVDAQDED